MRIHKLLQHTSHNPQPQHKLSQAVIFFVISTGTNTPFCPHPFVSPLCLSNLRSCVSLDPGCSSSIHSRPCLTSPPALTLESLAEKHSSCLLPWPGSPFILDNAAASDEGNWECQSVSWCLCLHKHKICRLDTKQMKWMVKSWVIEICAKIITSTGCHLCPPTPWEWLLCPWAWLLFSTNPR